VEEKRSKREEGGSCMRGLVSLMEDQRKQKNCFLNFSEGTWAKLEGQRGEGKNLERGLEMGETRVQIFAFSAGKGKKETRISSGIEAWGT